MSGYLLDTNVLSETRRRTPDTEVVAWLSAVPADQVSVSVLTIGELRYGVGLLAARDPDAVPGLQQWLDGILVRFGRHIMDVDQKVVEVWARLRVTRPLPAVDGLIAATAVAHNLTLVTRNTRDFAGLGVRLLNPFDQ